MVVFHLLLPMVLSPKSPENAVIQTGLDIIPTPNVRTVVFHGVVVNAVIVPLEVFCGRESLVALPASDRLGEIYQNDDC